jgi:hypothetical protein
MWTFARLYGKNKKHDFFFFFSALMETHDFHCSVIP